MPTFSDAMHRRAVIVIPVEQLAQLLALPPGFVCHGIHADPVRRALVLDVVDHAGGTLRQVAPGDVAPEFPPSGQLSREQYSVDQGDGTAKLYVRFGWEPADEAGTVGAAIRSGVDLDDLAANLGRRAEVIREQAERRTPRHDGDLR
ncbi:MAG: hypothetical protein ACEQSX_08015 [Baekduiaceae bacterium]